MSKAAAPVAAPALAKKAIERRMISPCLVVGVFVRASILEMHNLGERRS
jgi:hypothetical protein